MVTNAIKIMGATMLLSATSNGVGINVRLVGYGLSFSSYQGIYTFLEESNVLLDQSTVLQYRCPIHAGHCGETYHHVTDDGKFVVTFITTIRKPRRRYVLYVASKATQMMSFDLPVRWVIVVKHSLVLKGVKYACSLTKKQSIANSTSSWNLMSSLGTLTILCVKHLLFL